MTRRQSIAVTLLADIHGLRKAELFAKVIEPPDDDGVEMYRWIVAGCDWLKTRP